MIGHRFAAVLVFVPILANVGATIGFAAASTTGIVTRELSRGITETIRPLTNREQVRERTQAGKRDDINLTGQNCAASCGGEAGTGPNQADCNQIIDAVDALGMATFTIGPYSMANWTQASCQIVFVQSTPDTVTYAYYYLGNIASSLSDACNAANGSAHGSCIFDGREDEIWVGNSGVVPHF